MATTTIAIEINGVRQSGAVTIDVTTPPAEATYTLTCAGGTFTVVSSYDPDVATVLKKLDFSATATLVDQSRYRYVGWNFRSSTSNAPVYEPPPHSISYVAMWYKSGGKWQLTYHMDVIVFRFYTPRVEFWANGGVGAPAAIEARFGEAFALPLQTPTREGYVFAGWLPSDPSMDIAGGWESSWYSAQQPYTLDGIQYVHAAGQNICCLLGSSTRTEFRRLRPGERVIIDKSDIRRYVSTLETDNPWLTTIESADRSRLYRNLIDTQGPINMVAIWHRCTHMLIRDEEGNLLRGPDGRLLRDD